jgi:ribosome-binding protein aMBF1 (putative translation factor)
MIMQKRMRKHALSSNVDATRLPYFEARALIAERIKNARLNCGLSQGYVAQELHCNQSTISRIEAGEIQPDFLQIRMMSGLFGVSILWLGGYPSFVVNAAQSSSLSS